MKELHDSSSTVQKLLRYILQQVVYMIYVATCWFVVSSLEAAHKKLFQDSLWGHQEELEFPHANMK